MGSHWMHSLGDSKLMRGASATLEGPFDEKASVKHKASNH
jgi:hypothetical protein